MANVRQLKLVCGSESWDINTSPYDAVAGSWSSTGLALEFAVLVQATSLVELDRYVAALQRVATRAGLYDQQLLGSAVEVWTKTCDDLTTIAELGATWLRKRVKSMTLVTPDASESAAGRYALRVQVSCEVEELWRRAAPETALEVLTAITVRSDGGITSNAVALTGRRVKWTSTTGVTVRYRWLAAAANCDFFKVTGTTIKAWWDNANRRFKVQDNAGTPVVAQSAQYVFAVGDEVDVVFRWNPSTGMAIFVNGVADGSAAACTFAQADTYNVFEPTGSQSLLTAQLWPAVLTDAQCAGLAAWGRPEAELAVVLPPANTKNTNGWYRLYNAPGDASCPLRIVLDGDTQDYALVRAGLRPLRIPTTVAWECEAGTIGANTVGGTGVADATASGSYVAQFTPADAAYATRVTVVLCADPDDVAAMQGEHRLFLACKDNAATVGLNILKWRLVVAGQAEDYSDEYSAAAVSTYSLLDLGTVRIPPGQWPEESIAATTDVHAGSYITLELQVKNTAGSGTFNMDALFLAPAELEGTLTGTFDVSAWYEVLDFAGERPSFVGVADYRSMEFAAWADYVGDKLELAPLAGTAGGLWLAWQRDAVETWYSQDTCDLLLFVEPRWRR